MIGAERQILGHAFHQPERRIYRLQRLQIGAGAAARKHIVLELMRHLVREHMLERSEVARKRQHVALSLCVGHTAGALSEIAENVVLCEVGAAGEDDDRLPLTELMSENARQPRV